MRHDIHRLDLGEPHMAINAASFVEMPNDVIENYISFIKDSAKSISLVSYDLYDENTFNPEKLNKFFNNETVFNSFPSLFFFYKFKE